MRSILFVFIFFLIMANSLAQKGTMSVTIDDLPLSRVSRYTPEEQKLITGKLIHSFNEFEIPAIGFVNENKLYHNGVIIESRKALLNDWLVAGLELGNHTYSHPDYNRVSYREFIENISKGQVILNELCIKYNRPVRYFRHPFLHRGNSREKADSLAAYLTRVGLIEAPVTIDNSEWIFAAAYDSAFKANQTNLMDQIGSDYISYMKEKLHFYENQSQKLFDRNISHVLLIHANALNGDYMNELAKMIIENGYQFVSLTETLKDPVYLSEDHYYGNAGCSWIDRWALTRGYKKEFFTGEPFTPDYILKLAGVNYE